MKRQKRRIKVVDTHTEGEPTRILFREKLPKGCSNAVEAREYFRKHEDHLRSAILQEPRGHRDQFGSVVFPSLDNETDFSIFFTTVSGYLDMCAHATIGTSTALVFEGLVDAVEPVTTVKFDTPAGKIRVNINVKDGEAESVSLVNVPSFYLGRKDIEVGDPINDTIPVDIAFGGNFYAIVDGRDLGLEVDSSMIQRLRDTGSAICRGVYEQVRPTHPTNPKISPWPLAIITGTPKLAEENYRNIVVFPNGSFDRSPCGTGTSARSSLLVQKGELDVGDSFKHESVTDTVFTCKVTGKTKVGDYDAVLPEITGSAYVTQVSEIILNEEDPLKNGFLI